MINIGLTGDARRAVEDLAAKRGVTVGEVISIVRETGDREVILDQQTATVVDVEAMPEPETPPYF